MSSGLGNGGSPGTATLPLGDAILFQLALRGPARTASLIAATGCAADVLERELAGMDRQGWITRQPIAGAEHVVATPLGRQHATPVVAREAAALRPIMAELDGEFAALNRSVKQIMLRWQVRVAGTTEVLNDHADARYDAHVLADLRTAHAAADVLLERLAPLRARYASLRHRLRDALERAATGDRTAVAGVTTDSFHTAWWELHGDLLAILGRARTSSDA